MIYKRRGHWHLDIAINGERYRESLGTTDKVAKDKEEDRFAEIKAGKVASPAGKAFARLTLTEALEVFKNERVGQGVRTDDSTRS